MAKHNNTNIYPFDTLVSLEDGLLGFDKENSKKTRNYRLGDLLSFIVTQIGLFVGNQIISGSIIWVEDMDYLVEDLTYWISDALYIQPFSTTVTLDDADPTHPRIDVIYADTDGFVRVKTGVASANPVQPLLDDPETQIPISFILVNAGETTPAGVTEVLVYSDNVASDWANASTNLTSIDFDDDLNPKIGTKHIGIKEGFSSASLTFTNDESPVSYDSGLKLHLYLNRIREVDNTEKINVVVEDDLGNTGSTAAIANGAYGFDLDVIAEYQSIVIPFSDLGGVENVHKIHFYFADAVTGTIEIDHIRIVGGVEGVSTTNTYLGLNDTTDTSYVGKEGYVPMVANGNLLLKAVTFNPTTVYNGKAVEYIKHPDNNPSDPFEAYDFIKDYPHDNTLIVNLGQYLGGDQSDLANLEQIQWIDITPIP